MINIIAAVDSNWGFGKGGRIPWNIPDDFKHFQETTRGGICIMGRKTYEEIRNKMFPSGKNPHNKPLLNDRQSIVLTSKVDMEPLGDVIFSGKSLKDMVIFIRGLHPHKKIFLIGGGQVFFEGLDIADTAYISHIDGDFDCDVFFPKNEFFKRFNQVDSVNKTGFIMTRYRKSKWILKNYLNYTMQ